MENTQTRDDLAKDRTSLANQRTFLSYMRTVFGVVALALFIFKFAPIVIGVPLGAVTLVIALIIGLYGWRSYRRMENKIKGTGAIYREARPIPSEHVFPEEARTLKIKSRAFLKK